MSDSELDLESLFGSPAPTNEASSDAETPSDVEMSPTSPTAQPAPLLRRPGMPGPATPAEATLTFRGGFLDRSRPQPSTSAIALGPRVPEVTERALVPCLSPEEEWLEIRDDIAEYRAVRTRAKALEKEVFGRIDAFIERHGDRGKALVGDYQRLMHRTRLAREAEAAEYQRLDAEEAEAHAAAVKLRLMERLQREYQARTAQLGAEVMGHKQAERRLAQQKPNSEPPQKLRKCFVCGWPGVNRGRECPNRANHPR